MITDKIKIGLRYEKQIIIKDKGVNQMSFKNPDRLKKKKNKVWKDTRAPKLSPKAVKDKKPKEKP